MQKDELDTELQRLWRQAVLGGYDVGTKYADNHIYQSLQVISAYIDKKVVEARINELEIILAERPTLYTREFIKERIKELKES